MKYIIKSIAVIVLATASLSVYAQQKPMNMQKGTASGQGMKMDMGMSEEMKDKMARGQQKYILKLNDLSDRIQDEKNAKKKQALMDEQLQIIKDHQEKKRQMKKKMMQKRHQMMMNKKDGMKM